MHQTYPSPDRVPVSWQLGSVRHIRPLIGYIGPARHVRSPSQVPESWQPSLVGHIRSPLDISDQPDMSGLHRVPEALHPGLVGHI
jgi:hypothetical protein